MLTWYSVTRSVWNSMSTSDKSSDKLFFVSDIKTIYRGTEEFTEPVVIYKDTPTTAIAGKTYINATTLAGMVWDGSSWTNTINPVISSTQTNTTYLATTNDVENIIAILQTTVTSNYMFKVGDGHEGEIIIADEIGNAKASGVTIGGLTFLDPPTDLVAATEGGVVNFVKKYAVARADVVTQKDLASNVNDASDTEVPSEKAAVYAMSFKTFS